MWGGGGGGAKEAPCFTSWVANSGSGSATDVFLKNGGSRTPKSQVMWRRPSLRIQSGTGGAILCKISILVSSQLPPPPTTTSPPFKIPGSVPGHKLPIEGR